MRISDWSSDVCSSDLGCGSCGTWSDTSWLVIGKLAAADDRAGALLVELVGQAGQRGRGAAQVADQRIGFGDGLFAEGLESRPRVGDRAFQRLHRFVGVGRSEEHTYELQSLMRHSYAVFCL